MASLLFPSLLKASCASSFLFPSPVTDEKHTFSGPVKDITIWVPRLSPSKASRLKVRAEKFNLWQLLGGRGLAGGEEGLREELKRQISFGGQSPPSLAGQEQDGEKPELNNPAGTISANWIGDDKTFEKELQGMTGGFPGGEKGLIKFLRDNPPAKDGAEAEVSSESGKLSKPRAASLPSLLPGMIVIVKNAENPYHMLSGTVQRVTDGKVGVLFEGGNLGNPVTFKLEDLEQSKGPPTTAILETLDIP